MPFKEETETKYRGLAPHKITPMSGVHRPKISLLRLLVFSLVFDLGHHNSYRTNMLADLQSRRTTGFCRFGLIL